MEHVEIYSETSWRLSADLEEPREVRGPDSLHEIAAGLLHEGGRILDVGCRDAAHLVRLLARHSTTTAVGVDPVPWHLERAQAMTKGVEDRVELVLGYLEQLDLEGRFDLVWCRDVLQAVPDQQPFLDAIRGALAEDGRVLLYTVYATPLLAEHEEQMLTDGMDLRPTNLDRTAVEQRIQRAGLAIERCDDIGTEWREHEESLHRSASDALLQLARLRAQKERIVGTYGQQEYDIEEASLHWLAFILLGKLCPVLYVLHAQR